MNKRLGEWIIYSVLFMFLLISFFSGLSKIICGGLILGFFVVILNFIAQGGHKNKEK